MDLHFIRLRNRGVRIWSLEHNAKYKGNELED